MTRKRLLAGTGTGLLLLGSLSGCWDDRALNQRDLVLTLGIGPSPKQSGTLAVVFQIPSPSGLAADSIGGSGGQSPGGAPFFVIVGTGASFATAFESAQVQVSRDLYLGQTEVILLSDRLSPRLLHRTVATLDRLGSIAKTPYMVATDTRITRAAAHRVSQNHLPALYFESLFTCRQCQAMDLGVHLWQFADRLNTPGVDPALPLATPTATGYRVNREVLYRKYRPVGTLSPQASDALALLNGQARKLTVFLPLGHGSSASLRAIRARTVVHPRVVGGRVVADIREQVHASLDEVDSYTDTPAQVAAIARAAANTLSARAVRVLETTEAWDTDPLGVGRDLDYDDPAAFHALGPWHHIYPHVRFHVHLTVTIHRLGDIT